MNQSNKNEIKGELYKVSSSPDQQPVDQLPIFIKEENYQKILSQFQTAPANVRQEIQSKYQEFLEKHQEVINKEILDLDKLTPEEKERKRQQEKQYILTRLNNVSAVINMDRQKVGNITSANLITDLPGW